MTSPKVSICVPTYNYARFLPENIESILKQSFDDFELIIIDDCSNDNTKEVVNRYASCDNRIKFKINSCNVGMVQNWNLCLREAKGTYIKYVFGDDFLTDKDSLKKLVEAMESHPEVSLVSSARYIVDGNSKVMRTCSYFKDRGLMEGTKVINRCLLRGENLVGEPSMVLFKRNQANRGFNEKYAQWVDLEMWFHLLEQGLFAYSDEPLSAFRIHPQQQTEKNKANAATCFDAFYLCEYLHRHYITINNFAKSYIQFKYNYQIWKAYKKGIISKHLAFEKIKYHYSIIEFYFLFCLYKICRPFENLVEHFRKVQSKNKGSKGDGSILFPFLPFREKIESPPLFQRQASRSMNRLTILAHYDKDNLVDAHVRYFVDALKTISDCIIFVTTSSINQNDITCLKKTCDSVIIRENVGYDFVSWRVGMNSIANIADFDELVICNDSVYGPLYPLADIFEVMSKKDCDFWGMTENYEIVYHLQSYFLVFKKNVMNSKPFKDFWNSVQIEKVKEQIIKKYEVGLTQFLISAGFKPCAYASYSPPVVRVRKAKVASALKKPSQALNTLLSRKGRVDFTKVNPTLLFWKELIVKHKMPLIKVELLRDNPRRVDVRGWEDLIKTCSDYNVDLIKRHLARVRRRIIRLIFFARRHLG